MTKKDQDSRLVYEVPEAGALLGLSKNASYEAAKRGDFPTIRLGKLIRVPKAAFHDLLNIPRPTGERKPLTGLQVVALCRSTSVFSLPTREFAPPVAAGLIRPYRSWPRRLRNFNPRVTWGSSRLLPNLIFWASMHQVESPSHTPQRGVCSVD